MKYLTLLLVALLSAPSLLAAGFSEKRLESEKKDAAAKGKGVAFFFTQAYDPTNRDRNHAIDVDSNNNALKKAIPRKYVNTLTIDAGQTRDLDKIPLSVQKAMKDRPQLIVTDAACDKVLATLGGRPDRKKATEFEIQVVAALKGLPDPTKAPKTDTKP